MSYGGLTLGSVLLRERDIGESDTGYIVPRQESRR